MLCPSAVRRIMRAAGSPNVQMPLNGSGREFVSPLGVIASTMPLANAGLRGVSTADTVVSGELVGALNSYLKTT